MNYINLNGISTVLANRRPGIIHWIIQNNCLVIKSVAVRKKLSPLNNLHFSLMATGIETEWHLCLYLQYMLTEAPGYGCPLLDMTTGSRRRFSPLTVRPIVHHWGTLDSQAMSCCSSRSPASSLLPSHRPPCCCHLTDSSTCLASPRLPNHCETLRAAADGSGFQWRVEVGRKDRWDGLMGRVEVAKPAIRLHFQGGVKSHHWLNHLCNIRWFQQFHLMRKSTLWL